MSFDHVDLEMGGESLQTCLDVCHKDDNLTSCLHPQTTLVVLVRRSGRTRRLSRSLHSHPASPLIPTALSSPCRLPLSLTAKPRRRSEETILSAVEAQGFQLFVFDSDAGLHPVVLLSILSCASAIVGPHGLLLPVVSLQ